MLPLTINSYRKNNQLIHLSLFSAVMVFQLFLLAGLHYLCNSFRNMGMDPLWIGRKALVILSITEIAFLSLFLPIVFSFLFCVNSSSGQRDLLMILPKWQRIKESEILNSVMVSATLVLTVAIPAIYLYIWQVPADMLFRLLSTLFITAFFISAIHHFVYSLLDDIFGSVMSTYLILFSLIGGVILMNPVIEWAGNSEGIIQATLLLNPLVAVASSINLDILRTDPLYYLSSISTFKYHYPGFVQILLCYGFIGLTLYTIKIKFLERS